MNAAARTSATLPAEELLDFVAMGLKLFGPETRFTLYAHGHRVSFIFPPDPAYRAPVFKPKPVQTSALTRKTEGRNHEIVFGRQRRRTAVHRAYAR